MDNDHVSDDICIEFVPRKMDHIFRKTGADSLRNSPARRMVACPRSLGVRLEHFAGMEDLYPDRRWICL